MQKPTSEFQPGKKLSPFFWCFGVALFFVLATGSSPANSFTPCADTIDSSSTATDIGTCLKKIEKELQRSAKAADAAAIPNTILVGYYRFPAGEWRNAPANIDKTGRNRIGRRLVHFPDGVFNEPPVVAVSFTGIEISGGAIDLHVKATDITKNSFHIDIFGADNMRYGHFEVQWHAYSGNVKLRSKPTKRFFD